MSQGARGLINDRLQSKAAAHMFDAALMCVQGVSCDGITSPLELVELEILRALVECARERFR